MSVKKSEVITFVCEYDEWYDNFLPEWGAWLRTARRTGKKIEVEWVMNGRTIDTRTYEIRHLEYRAAETRKQRAKLRRHGVTCPELQLDDLR